MKTIVRSLAAFALLLSAPAVAEERPGLHGVQLDPADAETTET